MNAPLYSQILDQTLLPFLNHSFPSGHRFMQGNDQKRTSTHFQKYMEDRDMNWWQMRPESPYLNPIENMWRKIKEYLRWEIKPQTKQQLTDGIVKFRHQVAVQKCKKYSEHLLKKLYPKWLNWMVIQQVINSIYMLVICCLPVCICPYVQYLVWKMVSFTYGLFRYSAHSTCIPHHKHIVLKACPYTLKACPHTLRKDSFSADCASKAKCSLSVNGAELIPKCKHCSCWKLLVLFFRLLFWISRQKVQTIVLLTGKKNWKYHVPNV